MQLVDNLYKNIVSFQEELYSWIQFRISQLGLDSQEEYFTLIHSDQTEKEVFFDKLKQGPSSDYQALFQVAGSPGFPVGVVIHCMDKIVYANQAAADLIGAPDVESVLGVDVLGFIPQQDAEMMEGRKQAFQQSGAAAYPHRQQIVLPNGDTKWVLYTGIPTMYQGKPALQLWIIDQERETRERQERQLQVQLFQGITLISNELVGPGTTNEIIHRIFRLILTMFSADRVYIFQNATDSFGQLFTGQKYELVRDQISSQIENPILEMALYAEMGFERWADELASGTCLHGLVSQLPDSERPLMEAQGILSFMAAPILIGDRFWGFIGIDECEEPRTWTSWEQSAFQNLGLSIGNYFAREEAFALIKDSEKALDKAQEMGKIGSFVYETDSGKWLFSKMFINMFGPVPHRHERFLPQGIQLLGEETMGRLIAHWDLMLRSDQNIQVVGEFTYRGAEGLKTCFYQLESQLVDGHLLSIHGAVQDVTDQVKSTQALRESQELLDYTQAIGRIGSWSTNLLSGKTWYSPSVYMVLGLDPNTPLEGLKTLSTLFEPEDIDFLMANVMRTMDTGDPMHFVQRAKVVSGEYRYPEIYGELEFDAEGTPVKLSGTFQDISDRHVAKEKQQASDASLQALLESTKDIIAAVDLKGRLTSFNTSFKRLMKEWIGAKVRVGDDLWNLLQSQKRVRRSDMLLRVLDQALAGKSMLEQFHARLRTREVRSFEMALNPIVDSSEAITGVAIFGKDISRHLQNERRIKQLNTILERRVQERTQELQKINKELEAFAYSVSHDLRTPLRHLSGYSSLLVRRSRNLLDAESVEYLEYLGKSAKKMNQFVEDLLEYSRLGRKDMHMIWINPAYQLSGIIEVLSTAYPQVGIDWDVTLGQDIFADPLLLETVLMNLMSNAVKYRKSTRRLEVKVTTQAQKGGTLLTIEDNGIGFDMAYQEEIFGVFKRLHSEDEYEGSGIGLANVQRIMHRHGGSIWALAREGEGATFFCFFPGE